MAVKIFILNPGMIPLELKIKSMKNIMMFFMVMMTFPSSKLVAQRISVEGTKFMTGGGEIFMNGVNTPWNSWNDFGGSYDHDFWDAEFQRIRNAGGNSSRIWITCNGEIGVDITSQGNITGVSTAHWEDLEIGRA